MKVDEENDKKRQEAQAIIDAEVKALKAKLEKELAEKMPKQQTPAPKV